MNLDIEDFSSLIYLIIALITIKIIAPIFLPKKPNQPYIKEITVVIPSGGVQSTAASLRNAGFKKIYAISYDKTQFSNTDFTSYKQIQGNFGGNIENYVNSTFVLFSGIESFHVPLNLPKLPNKPMLIGYTFSQCSENGFSLLLPTSLEYSMITSESMRRFNDFSNNVLHNQFSHEEAFRVFTEFHSLHLLVMPCQKSASKLPKWETLEVIESENNAPRKPWGNIPKIPEVWRIRDIL
ncbi:hypothetical protein GPJ56_004799 [Histomonas meleagridis]|uniref:uncharacterized protein n=1 Tax=Histomonas meleagridis TaxID=135588 RepID=UPI00355A72AE|nr:hypothetical protein GPJ56_004799 [Histomonas meleagridis]KAH0803450.1 hypothetical protein GO595_003794 [Histomonas meleagridis]